MKDKKTVDQMIELLPHDRQTAILAKAEKINVARDKVRIGETLEKGLSQEDEIAWRFSELPQDVQVEATHAASEMICSQASAIESTPQFETLDDILARLPPERQAAIETGAEALSREIEVSRLK